MSTDDEDTKVTAEQDAAIARERVAEIEAHPEPMSDDSPVTPSKRGTNPRSLGNLRPGVRGEAPRNPEGNNGRTRADTVAAFLEETDDTAMGKALLEKVGCPGGTRIRGLLHREWLAGMGRSDLARKTLIEQYAGRPKQQVELSGQGGAQLHVLAVLPDNGRGPGDSEDPDDVESGTPTETG